MSVVPRRRVAARAIRLDRSLEALPLFRLSDSADDGVIAYADAQGGRWRVIPSPGDRLPGTFDQDVYVELLRRYHEAGEPADGAVTFTLHAFLRAMGRRVDGRTYEQLRSALGRLERTTLESQGIYESVRSGTRGDTSVHSAHLRRRGAAPHPRSRPARALRLHRQRGAGRGPCRSFFGHAREPCCRSCSQPLGRLVLGAGIARGATAVPAAGSGARRRPAHLAHRTRQARRAVAAGAAIPFAPPARLATSARHARRTRDPSQRRHSSTAARVVRRLHVGLATGLTDHSPQ